MTTTAADHASWALQGSVDASRRTYASVQEALSRSKELADISYEVFLQGSYANSTNTRGDSDVDVVVMMTSTFMPDISPLNVQQVRHYATNQIPGTTSFTQLRDMVKRALDAYFGPSRVENKNKCLKVAKRDGFVDADVVPAMQLRRFTSYEASGAATWIEGIYIDPLQGGRIINFPKEHIKQGQAKNKLASGNYKSAVRQVKRLRRKAVSRALLGPSDAPGYLLECLVSNVPIDRFPSDPTDRLVKVMAALHAYSAEDLHRLMWSCDRIHKLFDSDPGNHNQYVAKRVIDTLWDLL
jgi:hypothetical protein